MLYNSLYKLKFSLQIKSFLLKTTIQKKTKCLHIQVQQKKILFSEQEKHCGKRHLAFTYRLRTGSQKKKHILISRGCKVGHMFANTSLIFFKIDEVPRFLTS